MGAFLDDPHLNPRLKPLWQQFQQKFGISQPSSGYRDPGHNAAVGGAKGSAHMTGDALDVPMAGLDDAKRAEAMKWWKQQGATGLGFYPNSNSGHVDFRDGGPRAWGPNYSKSSLGETPKWFQDIANSHINGPTMNAGGTAIGGSAIPGGGAVTPMAPTQTGEMQGPPMPPGIAPGTWDGKGGLFGMMKSDGGMTGDKMKTFMGGGGAASIGNAVGAIAGLIGGGGEQKKAAPAMQFEQIDAHTGDPGSANLMAQLLARRKKGMGFMTQAPEDDEMGMM